MGYRTFRARFPRTDATSTAAALSGIVRTICRASRADLPMPVLGNAALCRRIEGRAPEGRCTFVVANFLQILFPAPSFDAAVCIQLRPHCESWPRRIGELCRVVRRAVLVDYPTTPSPHAHGPLFFRAKGRVEKPPHLAFVSAR